MFRKLTSVVLAAAVMAAAASGVAEAAAKKRTGAAKAPRESMETMVRKAVSEAIKDSLPAAAGKFEFMAKRMRPPKNEKWMKRWDALGQDGWQMVGNNENIYIFQRAATASTAFVDNKQADKAAKEKQKADNKAAAAAQKQADKDAKEAAKAAKKAAKSTKAQ